MPPHDELFNDLAHHAEAMRTKLKQHIADGDVPEALKVGAETLAYHLLEAAHRAKALAGWEAPKARATEVV